MALDEQLHDWRESALLVEQSVTRAVIGQQETIRLINVALFARGHVLLEGGVGVGKTTVLRAFSRAIGGDFGRVEGTIDMMPGDLIYHTYVDAEGKPRIDPGPLLRHGERLTTFFFNEINRARPQVQSLLLRAMAERSVSAFDREYHFPHMIVFADRNKVEREETFELASAARDRFLFELNMPTPTEPDVRRALVFDPVFHDVDALLELVTPGRGSMGGAERHRRDDSAKRERKPDNRALRAGYLAGNREPAAIRYRAGRRGHAAAHSRGRQSARHECAIAGRSRGRVARRPLASDTGGHPRRAVACARSSRVLHADLRTAAPGARGSADRADHGEGRGALMP